MGHKSKKKALKSSTHGYAYHQPSTDFYASPGLTWYGNVNYDLYAQNMSDTTSMKDHYPDLRYEPDWSWGSKKTSILHPDLVMR